MTFPAIAPAPASAGAATITVAETLALLDGPFSELAQGIAEGQYAPWLGSGVSRDVVDDLKGIVAKVLRYLREHADFARGDCPFAEALEKALARAQLSDVERAKFDVKADFHDWDPEITRAIIDRLTGEYAKLLSIRVKGKEPDFLLWTVVDVRAVYGDPALQPECEHLCVALLAVEGVVDNVVTANWDGLIELAVSELAGVDAPVLQVCVIADDFLKPSKRACLLKFHGCAIRARDDPVTYRELLVARQQQIESWRQNPAFAVMRQQMVSLATTRRTLMVGLSAQDINIRDVFREGTQAMPWRWPSHPPAYVFAEDTVGDDQKVILNSVYGAAYDTDPDAVVEASQIRAFAKPLLVALVLEILRRKLVALARCATAPNLSPRDRDELEAGLRTLRDRIAAGADADRTKFIRTLVAESARALRLLRAGAGAGTYEPLGVQTVNQVCADPANTTSGLPELAIGLGLLGLGEANGDWTVERADPGASTTGSLQVVPAGAAPQRVFFVANQEAALQLYVNGAVQEDEPDAVVVYSTTPQHRPTRSPRPRRRTGVASTRHVGLRSLLGDARDLDELRRRFRIEAVL